MKLYDIHLTHFPEVLGVSLLELRAGERILLLGHSGCGKTSLLKIIAGFSEPAEGHIDDEGQRCGILLQNPYHQIIMQNVHDELFFPQKNAGKSTKEAEAAVAEIVEILGIKSLLQRDIPTLSFGEIQLVMIAATCLTGADIILMDEPTSHLDYPTIKACYRCMDMLAARGKTVCVVSQTPDEYRFFDTVWIMKEGKIIARLSAAEFSEHYEKYDIVLDNKLIMNRLHDTKYSRAGE